MYRTIDVSVWQELWFEELSPNAKLLFFYLLTNSRQTACGAFQVTQRAVCHETNLTAAQLRSAMATLSAINKVVWWPGAGWVLLTRFYRHQRAKASGTYEVAARKAAHTLPDDVYQAVTTLYPELADQKRGYPYPTDTPKERARGFAREFAGVKQQQETEAVKQQQEAETATRAGATRVSPAPPARSSDPPEALFEALCEETGAEEASATPAFKRKQLAKAKDLLAKGHSLAEVRGCVHFLVSQSWRTNPIDLFTVDKEIGGWQFAGSPATAMPARASPPSKPTPMDNAREGIRRALSHDGTGTGAGHGITVRTVAAPGQLTGGSRGTDHDLPPNAG
jgi:hypothetical protein